MSPSPTNQNLLSLKALLRVDQIVRNKKKGIPGLLPIGRSTFLDGVKKGLFPKSVRISPRCVAWKAEEIYKLLESLQQ